METGKILLFQKLETIEVLVSDIYLRFSELFEDDREFWWRLSMEERAHAALIKSGMETFDPLHLFPKELLSIPTEEIDRSIEAKKTLLRAIDAHESAMDRMEALKAAVKIEEDDVESRFQQLMEKTDAQSPVYRLFKLLNKDSDEHANRIKAHIAGIEKL